jgi:hypothetical protein
MQIIAKGKQDRQCTNNPTLRCVRATIVAVERQYLLHILSLCLGIQHAMHMRHFIIWPAWLYNIFPHCLIKARFSLKKSYNHEMCVSIFFTSFV